MLKVSGKTGVGVKEFARRGREAGSGPGRRCGRSGTRDDLRSCTTLTVASSPTCVWVDGKIRPPREGHHDVDRHHTRTARGGHHLARAQGHDRLGVGEVGYLITGVKDVRQSRVGDTVTTFRNGASEPLTGYRDPKPMVYSGLYPMDGSDYPVLRDALDKLRLNDAALAYEPETSVALGFGFRCGFLGLLHMEITRDRLEREFGLDLISTAPNVVYRVVMEDGSEHEVTNPSYWPEGKVREVYEPMAKCTVIAPSEYTGAIMELCQSRRGELGGMDYLSETRVELRYTLPMGEIMFDFFDALKSRTKGYASLDYEESGEQQAALVKVDILLQGETVDAFSAIVHKDAAFAYGNKMTTKLRELIPVSSSRCRSRLRSARRSLRAKTFGRSARTCSPSATAATSAVSASCSRSRRRARSG